MQFVPLHVPAWLVTSNDDRQTTQCNATKFFAGYWCNQPSDVFKISASGNFIENTHVSWHNMSHSERILMDVVSAPSSPVGAMTMPAVSSSYQDMKCIKWMKDAYV